MKQNVLISLVFFLSASLNCSCAFAYGQRRTCEPADPAPPRPIIGQCISNGDGSAQCFDTRHTPANYKATQTANWIMLSPDDDRVQDEWIRQLQNR